MKYLKNHGDISFFCMAILLIVICPISFAANHALLIGIQDYPETERFKSRGLQQISGPRNDIKLLETTFLAPPFEFPKENIFILTDKDATHTAIEKAFADLSKRIKPNDFVYIHYSGHGSQHENANPKEDQEVTTRIGNHLKSFDSTWVAYGSSAGLFSDLSKDDRDILDDEIYQWLAEIGKITDRIVFVSDSCHSGSVSRGSKVGVRAIRVDPRPYPEESYITSGAQVGIRIGASMDNETAIEITQGGQSFGRFTWYWNKALKALKPGETWHDIFQRTEVSMREENLAGLGRNSQQPQIMLLNNKDFTVLGGEFVAPSKRVSVTWADEKSQIVRLSAGLLSGVIKGSVYRVVSASDGSSQEFPKVEITKTEPFVSEAKILTGKLSMGDLLIEYQRAYQFEPIPITIEGDDTLKHEQKRKIVEQLTERLNVPELFEVVRGRQNEGWIIYLLQPEKNNDQYVYANGATLPNAKQGAPIEVWVLNMQEELLDDTLRITLSNLESGIKELVDKMKKLAELRDLKMLNNPPPNVKLNVHSLVEDNACDKINNNQCFTIIEAGVTKKYRAMNSIDLKQMDGQKLPLNSKIGFSVENKTRDPYYLYILNISTRDGAFVQFPPKNRTSEYALINDEETRILDGGLFFPNPGQEIVKVILSRNALDPVVFEFEGTQKREQDIKRGSKNPLERLLSRTARRGGLLHAPEPTDWGTLQAQMEIIK